MPGPNIEGLAGADAAERWEKAPMDVKRQVVTHLMNVQILPAKKKTAKKKPGTEKPTKNKPSKKQTGFNPDLIEITWK